MRQRRERDVVTCVAIAAVACGGHAVRDSEDSGIDRGTSPEPGAFPATAPAQLVAGEPSLARYADGAVWGWSPSWSPDGVLHQGSARRLPALEGADDVTQHCALRGGQVDCWAYVGGETEWSLTPLLHLENLNRVRQIAEGARQSEVFDVFVYALRDDGVVSAEGVRIDYRLNAPPLLRVTSTLEIPELAGSVTIVAAGELVCGADQSGAAVCAKVSQASFDGPVSYASTEALVSPAVLDSGSNGICFIADGNPACRGTIVQRLNGVAVEIPLDVEIHVDSGTDALRGASLGGTLNGCALTETGRVYRTSMQGGPPDAGAQVQLDTQLLDGIPSASLAVAGAYQSCAAVSDGVYCWAHEGFEAWQPAEIR
jgi:hypothetical protein